MNNQLIQELKLRFDNTQNILIVSHIRPDGDAVGSLLGLGLALREAGKDVQMILEDSVPRRYKFLQGSDLVQTKPSIDFELMCVLDTSDLNRIGRNYEDYGKPDINIDHHVTNCNFATLNVVNPSAVSTTEILSELIPLMIKPLSPDVATALLTGLVTDTLGFLTPNMTANAMRTSAALMDAGANLHVIYRKTLVSHSYESIRLWGQGLNRLERNGRLVWTSLTLQDRVDSGYPGYDDADLINVLSSIEDTDIAMIFTEQPNKRIKVSWRSIPGFDVSEIALGFGGGGHPTASGADIPGKLQEVQELVLQKTQSIIDTTSIIYR